MTILISGMVGMMTFLVIMGVYRKKAARVTRECTAMDFNSPSAAHMHGAGAAGEFLKWSGRPEIRLPEVVFAVSAAGLLPCTDALRAPGPTPGRPQAAVAAVA